MYTIISNIWSQVTKRKRYPNETLAHIAGKSKLYKNFSALPNITFRKDNSLKHYWHRTYQN